MLVPDFADSRSLISSPYHFGTRSCGHDGETDVFSTCQHIHESGEICPCSNTATTPSCPGHLHRQCAATQRESPLQTMSGACGSGTVLTFLALLPSWREKPYSQKVNHLGYPRVELKFAPKSLNIETSHLHSVVQVESFMYQCMYKL